MFNKKGYIGNSESVRSRVAKENDRLPMSHWTKAKFLEVTEEERPDLLEKVKSLPLWMLKEKCLSNTEWHHTGSFYNVTRFYSINYKSIEALTDERIADLREEKALKDKEGKEEREARRNAKRAEQEALALMEFSGYKQKAAFLKAINSGKITIKELQEKKVEAEAQEAANLINSYLNQLKKVAGFKSADEFKKAIENGFDLNSINCKNKSQEVIRERLQGLIK